MSSLECSVVAVLPCPDRRDLLVILRCLPQISSIRVIRPPVRGAYAGELAAACASTVANSVHLSSSSVSCRAYCSLPRRRSSGPQFGSRHKYAPRPLALPDTSISAPPSGAATMRSRSRFAVFVPQETQVLSGTWRCLTIRLDAHPQIDSKPAPPQFNLPLKRGARNRTRWSGSPQPIEIRARPELHPHPDLQRVTILSAASQQQG